MSLETQEEGSLGVKAYMEEKIKRLVLGAGQTEPTLDYNSEQLNLAQSPNRAGTDLPDKP